MKKINEKYYDLDPSKQIAEYWNGLDSTDPNYCREILYKSGEGRYFLYGEHGKDFDLSTSAGEFTMSGEEVLPDLFGEAMGWLDFHDYWDIIYKEMADLTLNEQKSFSINQLKFHFNNFMDEFIFLNPQFFNNPYKSVKKQTMYGNLFR
jgi:hypothetical protein